MSKFQPGQSGNPLGRPRKIVEDAQRSVLLELFNEQAEREIIEAMIARAKSRFNESAAVSAATWLWDRVYGPVKQKTESHHTIDVTRLSDEELDRIINTRGG